MFGIFLPASRAQMHSSENRITDPDGVDPDQEEKKPETDETLKI